MKHRRTGEYRTAGDNLLAGCLLTMVSGLILFYGFFGAPSPHRGMAFWADNFERMFLRFTGEAIFAWILLVVFLFGTSVVVLSLVRLARR
jgi:hypothetical protein